jgi:hypothetical protein
MSIVTQSLPLLYLCCVHVSLSLSSDDAIGGHQWEVQTLSAEIRAGARRRCRVQKKVFTSTARRILF